MNLHLSIQKSFPAIIELDGNRMFGMALDLTRLLNGSGEVEELITNTPRQPRIVASPRVVHLTNATLVGPFRLERSILSHSKPSSGRTSPIGTITRARNSSRSKRSTGLTGSPEVSCRREHPTTPQFNR